MKIYSKIQKAKSEIKNTSLKKGGKNKFSNYDYFTPDQVEQLVFNACNNNGLLTKFDLERNEFGVVGVLSIIDYETSEIAIYKMATAIPEIKATNIAQQLGGCMTYTERYLKMSAFGITENSMDFDETVKSAKIDKPELKPETETWNKAKQAIEQGTATIEQIEKKYYISTKNKKLL